MTIFIDNAFDVRLFIFIGMADLLTCKFICVFLGTILPVRLAAFSLTYLAFILFQTGEYYCDTFYKFNRHVFV